MTDCTLGCVGLKIPLCFRIPYYLGVNAINRLYIISVSQSMGGSLVTTHGWLSGAYDDEDLIDDVGSDSHMLGGLGLSPCRHRFLPLHR